jgi:hypothetical protein
MMTMLSVGPTLAEAGRSADYVHFRDEALSRNVKLTDSISTSGLLKAILLMPAEEAVLARMRPHAERLAAVVATPRGFDPYQNAFAALSLAMMAYRSGDFKGALAWRDKCLAYPDSNQARTAAIHAVGAMAAQRLGQAEQARAELEKARAMFVAPFARDATYPRGEGNGFWFDWAVARILLREAESAVPAEGKSPR